jgi:signal transduction histidine kinase
VTRPERSDIVLAAVLLAAVVVEQALFRETVGIALLNGVGCAALAWRRVAPVTSCLVALAFLAGPEFVEASASDAFTTFLAIIVALFSLAAYAAPRRPLPAALAAIVLLSAVSIQASLETDDLVEAIAGGILFALVVVAGPALGVGLAVRRQGELRRRLEDQARELEAERERHAAAAADAERARIAGELHDVAAEGVRAMLADLAVARRAVVDGPETAGPAIGVVEERGRQALTEMRRLLGVLRRGDEDLALAPHPSLARLDALARAQPPGGPRVSLRVEGTPRALSAGLDVAAYRVVEDALAHATTAGRADVVVRWEPRDLALEIAVDGPELADAADLRPVGERVALFSGRLQAGRRPDGGSALRAALPVRDAS